MVREVGDLVQLMSEYGDKMGDIGIVVEQSAHDRDLWRIQWLNTDESMMTNGHYGDWYDSWVETGDLWAIREK